MITIQDMVQREVNVCLSSLVSTLAQGAYRAIGGKESSGDLEMLCEQAFELASPVPDYEEAAIQDGWEEYRDQFDVQCWRKPNGEGGPMLTWAGNAESLCRDFAGIDPYECEVYEHWSVSTWLAEKLIAQGEKVDRDFADMCVWARTTTGQAIHADSVIEHIYAELVK